MSLPLTYHTALAQPGLLAAPVADALRSLPWSDHVRVATIDPAVEEATAMTGMESKLWLPGLGV